MPAFESQKILQLTMNLDYRKKENIFNSLHVDKPRS